MHIVVDRRKGNTGKTGWKKKGKKTNDETKAQKEREGRGQGGKASILTSLGGGKGKVGRREKSTAKTAKPERKGKTGEKRERPKSKF